VLPPSGTVTVVPPVIGGVITGPLPVPVTGPPRVPIGVPPELRTLQVSETVLPCSVTAPVSAMTLPHPSVAPVFMLTLASAIISPPNEVVVPRVAELPTTQITLSSEPTFSIVTLEPLAVVSVLPVWMTMVSLLAPAKLRVRAPVN